MTVLEKVRQKIGAARKALGAASDSVEGVREAIRQLDAERQAVASAPVPLAEAVEAVEQTVDRIAAHGIYTTADGILLAAQGGRPATFDLHSLNSAAAVGFLVQCLRAPLRAALVAKLEDDYRDLQPGLPADARTEKLAQLDRELLELGHQEEQLITELAGLGIEVSRRGDADPRAVLGL